MNNNNPTVSLNMMIEGAREELEILETLHPNRFHSLKQDLHSLIFSLLHLHSHHPTSPPSTADTDALPTASSAPTQASTSITKKRKKKVALESWIEGDRCKWEGNGLSRKKKKDKVDMVLERAQACLRKIHDFKTQLKETC